MKQVIRRCVALGKLKLVDYNCDPFVQLEMCHAELLLVKCSVYWCHANELSESLAIDSLAGNRTRHRAIVGFLIIHEDELKRLKPGFKALSRPPLASDEPWKVKVAMLTRVTKDLCPVKTHFPSWFSYKLLLLFGQLLLFNLHRGQHFAIQYLMSTCTL